MDIQKLSDETKLKIENLKSQIDIIEEELPLFPITLLKLGILVLSAVVAAAISTELMGENWQALGLGLAVTIFYSCLKNIRVFKKHSKLKALQSEIKQLEEQLRIEIHKVDFPKFYRQKE